MEAAITQASIPLFWNVSANGTAPPYWMVRVVEMRREFFLANLEPIVCYFLGPVVEEDEEVVPLLSVTNATFDLEDVLHRRLGFLPKYIEDVNAVRETSMSFASLIMLFVILMSLFLIFLSCFYHNQKTSPLFISPRRHRLPKLVPPPLPVDGYFSWVKIAFLLSDEEIVSRIGYDALVFLRFHRLALRCIVRMSVFSFVVLLPLNFTGGGHANAKDLKGYVGTLFFTDFMRFTMANVSGGSPRLWIHCFAAYLLTGIVVRELLVEYETFNSIRHRYLLSREPHLRTVLVTNIPRHLRSRAKVNSYFRHVYPNSVSRVVLCQNCQILEKLVHERTRLLSRLETELLLLCRTEKYKLVQAKQQQYQLHHQQSLYMHHQQQKMTGEEQSLVNRLCSWVSCNSGCVPCCCSFSKFTMLVAPSTLRLRTCLEDSGLLPGTQERLTQYYTQLEQLNNEIEQEQRRRQRVMRMMDRMEAGDGAKDIDYILASPFLTESDVQHRRILGLKEPPSTDGKASHTGGSKKTLSPRNNQGGITVETVPEEQEADHTHTIPNSNVGSSTLRARSPATSPTGGLPPPPPPPPPPPASGPHSPRSSRQKNHPKKVKAKVALERYSRFASDVSFLGRPLPSPNSNHRQHEHPQYDCIEDHINEVSDKAFVVMKTFTAATIAIQSMHSSKPGSMQVATAPEPRDIMWDNIYISKGAMRTRSYMGEFLIMVIIGFYVVPTALVSLLVSESALVSSSPRLAQLDQASAFFSSAIAMVQPLCIVGIQQLLPPLFITMGRYEGLVSFSEVQMRAFSRYFLFQVLNVFLVTTIAGSIFDTIAMILENPESAFEMLGNSLPRLSSFFITFVTIKTFLGLGLELVRTMSLLQATARYLLFPNATLRTQRTVICGMRAIDDPGWFPFHKILAQDMLVVVISVVFAVVAPLVLLPCAMFCLFSRIIWTHHHLYVYESCFESGGQFWPKIFRRFVFGLIIAQMTITGQFILKEARHEAYATMALMFMTYFFLRSTRARYDPTSSTLPLEVATVMDISLQQEKEEEEARRKKAEHKEGGDSATSGNGNIHLGSNIGPYDPFEKAYVQPALRANPRARPEQPFPPAQLGREEPLSIGNGKVELISIENNINEGSLATLEKESSARVRLKSLNQHDRRLIDRWWNDQLQTCGDQRMLRILIGEECGTLTIGGGPQQSFRYNGNVMSGDGIGITSTPTHEMV